MRFNKVIFTLAFLFLGKAIYAQISTSKELYSLSSERSSELECYCHFNSDFTNFMNQYAALNAASNRWLAERENAFKNEINNRLGTNYSNFREAQKEFFKQYRDVKINATGAYNHIKSQLDNRLETNLFAAQKESASYQIYNLQKINIESINSGESPRFNLGQLFDKNIGKYVRDMSLNDFKSKMSAHDQNYMNNKKKYNSTKDELKYFNKSIKNIKRLEGYISDRYINHYNSYRDYLKRVQLMQTYLIRDYWYKSNPPSLSSPPRYVNYPDPYYSGGPEDYYDILERWNTEAPKITNDILSLNITESKTQFAINNFSSSAASDFIEDNKGYKEYLQRYWLANGYNNQSLKYAEYFLESFQGGDFTKFERQLAGRSHLYVSASEAEYQTRSNPEVIITTELSLFAIHAYALNGINHLLYGLSTIDSYNRNEWEGIHMKVILHSNDIPNISQFTSRELGKLFDFHYSYSENIKIGFADNVDQSLFSYDNKYGKSIFEDKLKVQLLKLYALSGDSEVRNIVNTYVADGKTSEAYTEALMKTYAYKAKREWDYKDTGIYMGRPGLSYKATYKVTQTEKMFLLDNGLVLYRANGKKIINKKIDKSLAASEVETDGYHYIYNYQTGRYYEYRIPPATYANADIDFLVAGFWQGVQLFGRYAVPLEDAIILIDGKDFNGEFSNRYVAGGMLLVSIVPGGKILKPVSKITKGTFRTSKVLVKTGSKTVLKNFDDLLELSDILSKLKPRAKYIVNGTGKYVEVGGHHPLAKIAFKGDTYYNLKQAFSVSTSTLESYGGKGVHNIITGQQNRLYSTFAKTGERLTLDKMAEIEIEAMVNSGIPRDIATGWVVKALVDLKTQGVKYITNIPWNGLN